MTMTIDGRVGPETPRDENEEARCVWGGKGAIRRISVLVALVGVIALVATACGGGSRAASPGSRPAATTTSSDPQAAERGAVLAAYQAYNAFYDEVVAKPDPNNPALAAHLTGDALARMRLDQAAFSSTHEGLRFSDESYRPVLVSLDLGAQRAVVDDCVAAIAHYFDTRTGQPQGAPPLTKPSSEGFEFVFVKEAAVWKLSEKHSKPSACQHA